MSSVNDRRHDRTTKLPTPAQWAARLEKFRELVERSKELERLRERIRAIGAGSANRGSHRNDQRRLADEYDAARERGEVAKQGDPRPSGMEGLATIADIGLTHTRPASSAMRSSAHVEHCLELRSFRKLRPVGGKPQPGLSVDRPHCFLRLSPTFLGLPVITSVRVSLTSWARSIVKEVVATSHV
jgi:hypothetical protein